ncbi:CFI-box-CTERM domain-containing protein [Chloroflexota bacterium]
MEARVTINRLTERTTRRPTGALALLISLCLIAGGVMPAYATEPPPEMPHQFYGTVSLDDDPVEEGTMVEAFVDDVKQAETTVDAEGRYGYNPIFRVPGTAGATVTFRVGGVEADEDATWESGKVQELDLTIHEEPAPPVQYNLTISSTTGGSVTIPGEGVFPYYAGAKVQLLAEPEAGYQFIGWTAPAGTFSDETTKETTFTMPAQAVTVTASFEEVPLPTVSTQAATDVTSYSAKVNMSYTVANLSSVEVRFACKRCTDSAWFYTDWVSKTADGDYAEVLTGLASQTGYEFKAQLRNVTVIEGVISRFCTARGPGVGLGDLSCPVAVAAYETRTAERLHVLREFRDVVLLRSAAGPRFVPLYYQLSPPIAALIASRDLLRTLVRELLVDPLIWIVDKSPLGQYTKY